MNIHIHTQYCENYGDVSSPYWKFKGGNTYVITGFALPLNDQIGRSAQTIVDAVRPTIESKNDYFEEYILDWEFADEDTLTDWERDQQEFDGSISSPSPRIEVAL